MIFLFPSAKGTFYLYNDNKMLVTPPTLVKKNQIKP
jgi:hypothetical protein